MVRNTGILLHSLNLLNMKMKLPFFCKWLLPLVFVSVLAMDGNAQGKTGSVAGVVRNEAGEPLQSVSVVARNAATGLTSGAQTDSNGVFRFAVLPVDGKYSFTFSIVGYEPQSLSGYTLKEGQLTNILVKLKSNSAVLSDVVVIGYGTQKKSSLTASVASISPKEIQKQVTGNIASAFQGRTPGVEVLQQGGVAGADVNIVIRGAASFGSIEPLYVVDGIFSNNGLSTLNPIDIESIEILKDAAAAAIYGSRAANGVVLITTKKGRAGKPVVEVNATYSVQKPTNIPEFLNASEWR